ncbi:MAG: DUF4411 family protein [Planctomycetaceae bacterium]
MSEKFLLDANAFIEPRDRYYAYDICPGYWTTLVSQHNEDRVCSLDRIRDELIPKKQDDWDDIAHWIDEKVPTTFFKKTEDQAVIDLFGEMVQWVYSEPQYYDTAKSEFASVADGWIVAYAAINGLTVVTHEQYSPDAKKRVMIPNVCMEYDVKCVDTFAMLRTLGAKFISSTKHG